MMAQFLEIKQDHPDALLFYRMGDFYEMFFDDAVLAAEALDIALTKRGKHNGEDIPMCGVPHHAAEGYFLTLIRKGFRVAVCEQLENPAEAKKRGSKSVVKRGVVRLVTPGTLTEDSLLNARHHNYLASVTEVRGEFAVAWVDVSTGAFRVQDCTLAAIAPLLARISAKEVLMSEATEQKLTELNLEIGSVTILSAASFDSASARDRLMDLYSVSSLDGFGNFSRAQLSSMGAVLDYLHITQKGKLPLLRHPMVEHTDDRMQIDAATRRNLELTHNLSGGRDASLLKTIDTTVTNGGARLLEHRLCSPTTRLETLNERQENVAFYVEEAGLRQDIREQLRSVGDIDRALSRVSLQRCGPRDLAVIRDGLHEAIGLAAHHDDLDPPESLTLYLSSLVGHESLIELLSNALEVEPPLLPRDGSFIRKGYDAELDEVRELRDGGRQIISKLQSEYTQTTGITALKIKHNNVLGYFIETPATHADKMLGDAHSEQFIHRQTTANAVRFTTVELSELETNILNASGRGLEIEKRIFTMLCDAVLNVSGQVSVTSKAMAEIDLSTSFAELSETQNWSRPILTNGREFEILDGRHPVVEKALNDTNGTGFVPNNCDLSVDAENAKPIWLLTGPNMAGKSTFLRQNALVAILAQIGSYVPASRATIGIVTQLFSRVGASDDLARGRSTFMVEMVETAAILNQADQGALVILDEIGRGTATYDGLSIAWASLEHLHDVNQCRALFATHYHELTGLTAALKGLSNATVTVREWEGEIVFLHEVKTGAADRSYGVQVAKLAGLPAPVINRAKEVLEKLEQGNAGSAKTENLIDELPLFNTRAEATPNVKPSLVEDHLRDIHPDELSPRDALTLIYELKSKLVD